MPSVVLYRGAPSKRSSVALAARARCGSSLISLDGFATTNILNRGFESVPARCEPADPRGPVWHSYSYPRHASPARPPLRAFRYRGLLRCYHYHQQLHEHPRWHHGQAGRLLRCHATARKWGLHRRERRLLVLLSRGLRKIQAQVLLRAQRRQPVRPTPCCTAAHHGGVLCVCVCVCILEGSANFTCMLCVPTTPATA